MSNFLARVSDISVIVCFPSIVGSTGHCVSSFVLVFLVLVGNLVIVLSPGSLWWHSFVLGLKCRSSSSLFQFLILFPQLPTWFAPSSPQLIETLGGMSIFASHYKFLGKVDATPIVHSLQALYFHFGNITFASTYVSFVVQVLRVCGWRSQHYVPWSRPIGSASLYFLQSSVRFQFRLSGRRAQFLSFDSHSKWCSIVLRSGIPLFLWLPSSVYGCNFLSKPSPRVCHSRVYVSIVVYE